MKGLRQLKLGFADPRMKELIDTIWREYYGLYVEKYNRDPEKWLLNAFSPEIDFGQAIGQDHLLEGNRSVAIGQGLVTKAFMELALGGYNLVPEGQDPEAWNPLDLLFTIGNGVDTENRSNAIEIFKSGLLKLFNAFLIGEYAHGDIDPLPGMLQYTEGKSLELYQGGKWNSVHHSARGPDNVEKKTGIDEGYFGQISVTDDYQYICVQGGIAGVAIWKKFHLLHT